MSSLAASLSLLVLGVHAADVRVIDATGGTSYAGLLQVKTEFGLGSVCGMTQASASVACKQLGYTYGTTVATPCSSFGGENACGTVGSTVAMKNLKCSGDEGSVQECAWEDPDAECASHLSDSVIFCSAKASRDYTPEGTLRLLDAVGAPSLTGVGRLEVYQDGWASVCSEGFTEGSEQVACKAMGYSSVARSMIGEGCGSVGGADLCGGVAPALSKVACSGSESGLMECGHDGKESAFCASEDNVVLHCAGQGNAQGYPFLA